MSSDNSKYFEIIDSYFERKNLSPKTMSLFFAWYHSIEAENNEEAKLALLQKFESYDVPYDAGVEKALLNVQNKIGLNKTFTLAPTTERVSIGRWAMRVAAVLIPLIMICGAALFFLNQPAIAPIITHLTFHAPADATKQVTLTCNSQVWLKAGSSLVYAKADAGNREVNLSGKAHFTIERNEERPFLVNTEYLQMTVLGTEFTVKEIEGDNNTLVTLTEGSLQVQSFGGKAVVLQPGDQLIFDHLTGTCTVHQLDEFDLSLANIWKEERLIFQESPLKQMIRTINAYYFNRAIDFSNFTDVGDIDFTIRFSPGESLETTLYILRILTDGAFNYRFVGERVYIYN